MWKRKNLLKIFTICVFNIFEWIIFQVCIQSLSIQHKIYVYLVIKLIWKHTIFFCFFILIHLNQINTIYYEQGVYMTITITKPLIIQILSIEVYFLSRFSCVKVTFIRMYYYHRVMMAKSYNISIFKFLLFKQVEKHL